MKQINLFPVELFEFENAEIDNERLIELCEKEPFQDHTALSSLDNIHLKEEYSFFFRWVSECLEQLRNERKYDCERIAISSSWCNKYEANLGASHLPHKHSMSWYSGIYYMTEGAPTLFDDPLIQRTGGGIEVGRREWFPLEPIWPKAGKLLIFPSWLPHSTVTHELPYDRWTIAFNTLPAGEINYNLGRDSIAILDVGAKLNGQ